ncbi:MAG: glycosyltransferase involved in cell wall biosynthesis [Candidatus Azotimanducaceae bacterium]|jgi:glycosyltransferase involved in cell wall biosynthesis
MIVSDDHLYPAGGAEQAFGNITKCLPHITFDLVCARLRRGAKKEEEVGNVHIHRIGFGIPKFDAFLLGTLGHFVAYRLSRKHRYDLVWSIMASYGGFVAVRVKKKLCIPMVLTLQEGDSFEYIYRKVRFVRKSFNAIFSSADGLQAISHYLQAWGVEMGFVGSVNKVVPNGVDIASFTRKISESEILDARRNFGFSEHATILFTSSRLEKKNGISDVIAALPKLSEDICFVVCGSGSLDAALKTQVATLGLGHRVLFKGFVDPIELPLLMRASDVFIRPSLSEGLGNAFLEAMAADLIIVGTNAGGIPDFLLDGKTGFMVEIKNSKSIAETIIRIISLSPQERERIIRRASSLVITQYNWEVVTQDIQKIFNAVTQK